MANLDTLNRLCCKLVTVHLKDSPVKLRIPGSEIYTDAVSITGTFTNGFSSHYTLKDVVEARDQDGVDVAGRDGILGVRVSIHVEDAHEIEPLA